MSRRQSLTVTAIGYSGQYDTQEHYGSAQPSVTEGTTLEYSVDDGATWSSLPPSIRDVGTIRFRVRAHNDTYGDATAFAALNVTPVPVKVIANPAQEAYDSGSHDYTAREEGLIDDYQLQYVVENTLLANANRPDPSKLASANGAPAASFLASGRTATVAAEVWIRPWDSVFGIRCTRWMPDSNFRQE